MNGRGSKKSALPRAGRLADLVGVGDECILGSVKDVVGTLAGREDFLNPWLGETDVDSASAMTARRWRRRVQAMAKMHRAIARLGFQCHYRQVRIRRRRALAARVAP